ncbi:MAG: DUF5069 domain-containing protein [Leptospirillum sp.]
MAHDGPGDEIKTDRPETDFRPRGGRLRLEGLPWLGRMIDKGRASLEGRLGDYEFPCGMDWEVLRYLKLDPDAFISLLKTCADDESLVKMLGIRSRPLSERAFWAEVFEVRFSRLLDDLDDQEQKRE